MSLPFEISPILKSPQEPKTKSEHLFDTVVTKDSGDQNKNVKKKNRGKHVAGF